jgi:circadian clock protein KaiC
VPGLDAMLGGEGFYRGTSVLLSGTAGTGKTSLAAHFADAACRRGERCLYLAFEESASQLARNMRSIGLNLEPWIRNGTLRIDASRPTIQGLEHHLSALHRAVEQFAPRVVIVDPITNFLKAGTAADAEAMVTRLIDFLKAREITALFTSLTHGGSFLEQTEVGISSLIDTWILLRDVEEGRERNRVINILKSRGMAHSNQIRGFRLTARGVELVDAEGPAGSLRGRPRQRVSQEGRR